MSLEKLLETFDVVSIQVPLTRETRNMIGQAEPGDREKAMSLLDESLAISTELGMRPLMERVLSRREILGA